MGQVRNEVKGRPLDADHAKELGHTPGKVLQYNATVQWIAPVSYTHPDAADEERLV